MDYRIKDTLSTLGTCICLTLFMLAMFFVGQNDGARAQRVRRAALLRCAEICESPNEIEAISLNECECSNGYSCKTHTP